VDVIALTDYGIRYIYDPLPVPKRSKRIQISHLKYGSKSKVWCSSLAVAHAEFLDMDLSQLQNKTSLLYDVKGVLGDNVDGRL
jgi:UDP-N-acetyl-D-galactosamine dehydrogenase